MTHKQSSKNINKESTDTLGQDLHCLYTNADQFVNKRDDLVMSIAGDKPDIILITEVIPKNQINPITQALLDIDDYECLLNFV